MLDTIEIPEYVDDPIQILVWEMDEFGVVMCVFFVGMMAHQMLISLLFIYVFVKFYISFKADKLGGFYVHAPYRAGLIPLNKWFPNGGILEYHS
jgi:conjugal transfer pilus assembly protein TraL